MILLIRHCTPKIDYSKCNYLEANKRIDEYNSTDDLAFEEMIPFKSYLNEILENKTLKVFSSSLPRALLTARQLFDERQKIIISDDFIEFDLAIKKVPLLRFKFKTWLLISRILWFLNILKTKKSFANERFRTFKCAELLHQNAQKQNVILVAHGLLNIFIEKQLKKTGYKRINKVKNNCFTIIKLTVLV